jgi:hypothetical protein
MLIPGVGPPIAEFVFGIELCGSGASDCAKTEGAKPKKQRRNIVVAINKAAFIWGDMPVV